MSACFNNKIDITFFVPCYNKEQLIALTLTRLIEALRRFDLRNEVIVADDCFRENASEETNTWMHSHPEVDVTLVRNERSRGLAKGFIDTAFRGKGKFYRPFSGDHPEPVPTLIQMFERIVSADISLLYHEYLPGKGTL